MTEGEATNGTTTAATEPQGDVDSKIIRQIEYYFGDYNLPRDKFLQEEIKKEDGWVALSTMLNFKRLASLSTDTEVIANALAKSEQKLMEISEDKVKIRRDPNRPLPTYNDDVKAETMKRTIYCKGFPKDGTATLDTLLKYFQNYGPYETVLMRYFYNDAEKKQGFKGSVLVVFPNEEKAKEFLELEEVKYENTSLIRKWHADYVEEKRKEVEERKAKRNSNKKKNGENEERTDNFESIPKGVFIRMTEVPVGTTREELKEAIGEKTDQLSYVDFSNTRSEGYLRFKTEGSNKEILEKLGEFKIKDTVINLSLVEGEEEEQQIKTANEARSKVLSNIGKKRKFGGVGRGGFRGNKRRRN
ncbi:unnamed protein product [Meganyctiphanes norvegica]|uniref:La protein n=1 Tax=Meganyctiphanes norvegica TaxID=48144 RepID=A0AAV2SKY3_MEGNR